MRPGTSWCPEVGLGIPNLTSGHFRSFDETFELLVCMGPLEQHWFCMVFVRAALHVCRHMFFAPGFVLSLRVLEGRQRVLGIQKLVWEFLNLPLDTSDLF